jgi:hypothetical protein
MKNNIKALQLIEKGLSAKTVSKLTESQIRVLHKKLFREAQVTTASTIDLTADEVKQGYKVPDTLMSGKKNVVVTPNPKSPGGVRIEPTTEEVNEDDTDDVTDQNAFGKDALSSYTGQDSPHDADDMAPDGMDDDSDNDRKMMGMSEENEKNPWEICTSQLGKEFKTTERSQWSSKQKAKYERCVKDVKKSLKEEKNKVSLFIESQIMKIVEKNIPPRITKGDLVKFLTEQKPAVAPSKPAPTTKPGKPAPKPNVRPSHPGKNPNPNVKPAPKAISPEKAKDEVIDLIMKLLEQ